MKVALVSNFPFYSGTGKVAFKIWRTLNKLNLARAELFLTHYLKRAEASLAENQGARVLQPFAYDLSPALSRIFLYAVEPHLLPKGFDLYHFGNQMIARFGLGRRPAVVTVHDVLQFQYPERFGSLLASRVYNFFMERSLKSLPQADHLICVSAWSRRELLKIFPQINPERVSVVYNGLDHSIFFQKDKEKSRRKLGWPLFRPIILHLGSEIPRKQVPLLLTSFKKLKAEFPQAWLVRHGEQKAETKRLIGELGLTDDILYYGYSPEADLKDFYSAADVLVQPSSEEGFCFPVVEAMACGLPVVASPRASLIEVCGGAAVTMANLSVADVAESLSTALRLSETARRELVEKGFKNAQRFNWEKTARAVFAIYEKVLQGKKNL